MEERNWLKIILTPLSWLYGTITILRNLLYDKKIIRSQNAVQFVISVGNLTVGGTGKTPMTEYLVRRLSKDRNIAILSRGYGRKTKGFVLANGTSSAQDIGDEPLQYYQKYGDKVTIAVCEDRVNGARNIHKVRPEINLLLLDDAYQHRAIGRNINILLNDFNRPFYQDLPFPAGRLRETRRGAGRADAVIVTKCPANLGNSEKSKIEAKVREYCQSHIPIYFSTLQYGQPIAYGGMPVTLKKVKLVAGIANPQSFFTHQRSQYNVIEEIIFPDHHNYSSEDINRIIKNLKNGTFVLTTEKDMVKIKPLIDNPALISQFAYVPVAVDFGNNTDEFNQWIIKQIP